MQRVCTSQTVGNVEELTNCNIVGENRQKSQHSNAPGASHHAVDHGDYNSKYAATTGDATRKRSREVQGHNTQVQGTAISPQGDRLQSPQPHNIRQGVFAANTIELELCADFNKRIVREQGTNLRVKTEHG